ncbi:acyl-CoA dehydrogenase family protein [Mycolicibacterium baixiangningiae]|uniref:acyl-CoA dehydrogenase family protein n=1 Tax=Mycolicibacterium baixiangningiae TaxID=2761578 RepID=UPI0018678161|nr:acyl-CoA dehydrogenase family protein [Mycolicibacterium baixiangningiae]
MDITFSAEAEAYREQVREFLKDNVPQDWRGIGALAGDTHTSFLKDWTALLSKHKLLAPAWPTEYGGAGLSPEERVVLAEEFALAGVPTGDANDEFSVDMLGNTLLEHGTPEQKDYFLPRILSKEIVFCQGFSEPDAGSDLSNVRTKATLEGDHWVVDGQKIWTSDGLKANWIFALVRTEPGSVRHHGLTMMLIPIDQPGVELRPIKMITGDSEFCETFFTQAVTERGHVVGEVGDGWKVAMSLLGHERGETAVVLPLRFSAELDRLVALIDERGLSDDPKVRVGVAECQARLSAMRLLGLRNVSSWVKGMQPGPESSIAKLVWSEYHVQSSTLGMEVLGSDGLVAEGRPGPAYYSDEPGADPLHTASWQTTYFTALGSVIYGGTSEIQRNIVAERVLGLPRS